MALASGKGVLSSKEYQNWLSGKGGISSLLFFFFNFYLFIYLWLCWVFIAAHGLSLVAVSGG